jgi:hypothetical protein
VSDVTGQEGGEDCSGVHVDFGVVIRCDLSSVEIWSRGDMYLYRHCVENLTATSTMFFVDPEFSLSRLFRYEVGTKPLHAFILNAL